MLSPFWSTRRVLITGGNGFLGRFIRRRMEYNGAIDILTPSRAELDLRERDDIREYLLAHKPSLIIHAAAVVGGIGANRLHPGRFFYENAIMGLQLIEEARRASVEKLVCLGTICSYPKFAPVPFREEDLWNGYPEETNAPYGIAKKALLVQLQSYRDEYGFNGVFLLPVNLYGPEDNFDEETSHVIPAIVRKLIDARDSGVRTVRLWGDGSPSREFLYVEDAAQGIVTAAERYNSSEPVNLGRNEEVTIRDLAALIASMVEFSGDIAWDRTRPNGQPRRRVDASRSAREFGFQAPTSLKDGLRKTIEWYESARRTRPPRAVTIRGEST